MKAHLSHLEESHSCEEWVRPCLMLRTNSLQLKLLCHLLQTALRITWWKSDTDSFYSHALLQMKVTRGILQGKCYSDDSKSWNKTSAMAIYAFTPSFQVLLFYNNIEAQKIWFDFMYWSTKTCQSQKIMLDTHTHTQRRKTNKKWKQIQCCKTLRKKSTVMNTL